MTTPQDLHDAYKREKTRAKVAEAALADAELLLWAFAHNAMEAVWVTAECFDAFRFHWRKVKIIVYLDDNGIPQITPELREAILAARKE